MKDYENMSNNQIMSEIILLKQEHESLKIKMLKDFDRLEEIEKEFKIANEILNKRINTK